MGRVISIIYRTKIGMELLFKTTIIGLLYLICLVILYLFISHQSNRIYQDTNKLDNINQNVNALIKSMVDQETGQRGYNLSGDKQFLEPYNRGTHYFVSLSRKLKTELGRNTTLYEPVSEMLEKGFDWHEQYGAKQVHFQNVGVQVTKDSLLQGKREFDEFRKQSDLVLGKIKLLKKEDMNRLSSLTFRYHLMQMALSFILFGIIMLLMLNSFRKVSEPILKIRMAIKEFAVGNLDYPLLHEGKNQNEIYELVTSLNVMRFQLQKTMEQSRQIAEMDSLTGIYNRGVFDKELNKLISNFYITGKTFSLILIDIDRFKVFNDTYGHTEGDRILCHVTNLIAQHVRNADVFARYGGEEFAILVNSPSPFSFAERLRSILDHNKLDSYHITASFGITEFRDGDRAKSFIDRADKALYKAKSNGRNRVEIETL